MFDDAYLLTLKIARWRDLQLAQTPGAEARAVRENALDRLIRTQTLIAAIEATRTEGGTAFQRGFGRDRL